MDRVGGRTLTMLVTAIAALLLSGTLVGAPGGSDRSGTRAAPGGTAGLADPPASPGPPARPPLARVEAASREAVGVATAAWMPSAEGFLVAAGEGAVVGAGRVVRFTVEVEAAIAERLGEVVAVVEEALFDPRSWTASGRHGLQRVDDPARAHVRIVLADPETVDRACARIGLDTRGHLSCWDGRRAMLNSWRFDHGAAQFDSLADYRRYLVNHEVGHGLGYDHLGCPRPGEAAPLMMQQTKSLGGCVPNPWPHP